jgi:hypothetical protein
MSGNMYQIVVVSLRSSGQPQQRRKNDACVRGIKRTKLLNVGAHRYLSGRLSTAEN